MGMQPSTMPPLRDVAVRQQPATVSGMARRPVFRSPLSRALPGLVRLLVALLVALPSGLLSDGAHPALAAAGDLDTSFDGDGIVVSGLDAGNAFAVVAMQPDGKILAAANGHAPNSGRSGFAVQRLLPDGRLDPTFGAGGTAFTYAGADNATLHALALQADGKIVVGGNAVPSASAGTDFALARFLPDGRLDTGFGSGGTVLTDIGGGDAVSDVAIQPGGKIVAAGGNLVCPFLCQTRVALTRYNPDGSLDASFGSGGTAFPGLPADSAAGARMVVQADGKILVAGTSNTFGGLVRLTSDGHGDGSFGAGGLVNASGASALALQADGKIVVAGTPAIIGDAVLLRFTSSGNPDPTFGSDGLVTMFPGQLPYVPGLSAVVVQADGKIVVGGGASGAFVLARFTPSGSPDFAFGTEGQITTTSSAGSFTNVVGLALQSDGKLLAAGGFSVSSGTYLALTRYQTAPDPGAGGKGLRIGSDEGGRVLLGWNAGTDQTAYWLARSPFAVWPLPADAGGYVDTSPAPGPALNCYQLFALGTSSVLAASDALCVQIGLFDQNRQLFHFNLRLNQSATTHMTWSTGHEARLGWVLLALPLGGAPRTQILAASATTVDDATGWVPTCYILYAVYAEELDSTDLTCALPGHSFFGAASATSAQRPSMDAAQASARTAAESLAGRAAATSQAVTETLPAGRVKVEEAAAQLRGKGRGGSPRPAADHIR